VPSLTFHLMQVLEEGAGGDLGKREEEGKGGGVKVEAPHSILHYITSFGFLSDGCSGKRGRLLGGGERRGFLIGR